MKKKLAHHAIATGALLFMGGGAWLMGNYPTAALVAFGCVLGLFLLAILYCMFLSVAEELLP